LYVPRRSASAAGGGRIVHARFSMAEAADIIIWLLVIRYLTYDGARR
jgi:hypothetical protein